MLERLKTKLKKLFWRLSLGFVLLSLVIVVPFRWIDPPISMVMLSRTIYAQGDYQRKHTWLDWNKIPKSMALAVVASEDQRFPFHDGFDWRSIRMVITAALHGEKLVGASTISQQVAKNMYLWTGRNWIRKGLEAWFTFLIESIWGKQRILEVYLNIAEWGNGVFGIEAASQYHFHKPINQLSSLQMALLAASLPNPLYYKAEKPDEKLLKRAHWILLQQKRLGGVKWITGLN